MALLEKVWPCRRHDLIGGGMALPCWRRCGLVGGMPLGLGFEVSEGPESPSSSATCEDVSS